MAFLVHHNEQNPVYLQKLTSLVEYEILGPCLDICAADPLSKY